MSHDMCVFVRKLTTKDYHIVVFDPNYFRRCNIVRGFIELFPLTTKFQGLHAPGLNPPPGNCTKITWTKLLKFICKKENPYKDPNLMDLSCAAKMFLYEYEKKCFLDEKNEKQAIKRKTNRENIKNNTNDNF